MKGLLFISLIILSCGSSQSTSQEMAFNILAQHEVGGYTEASEEVITNALDFKTLSNNLALTEDSIPTINFENQTVAAVFLGEKPTGGYTILVKNVTSSEDSLQVVYTVREPQATDFVTMVMTQPYCVISFDNPENKSVTFIKE